MITRLSTTLAITGALLSMNMKAGADDFARIAHRYQEYPARSAPAPASRYAAPLGRYLILARPGALGRPLNGGENAAEANGNAASSATPASARGEQNVPIGLRSWQSFGIADSGLRSASRHESAGLPTVAAAPTSEPASSTEINFIRPVVYSLSFMAIGFGGFVAGGILKDEPSLDNFRKFSTSTPHFEDDSALFNFVLHPLWGSETYLRAREAHFGIPGSITFSLGASATWEYLFESWTQRPSTQDLILTTGLGWIIGEGRYYLKNRLDPKYHWWVDPIYTTLQYFDIGVNRDPTGHTQTTLRLTWGF